MERPQERVVKLFKYVIIAVIVIVVLIAALYAYQELSKPPPAGPPEFHASGTFSFTTDDHGKTAKVEYTPVSGTGIVAIANITATRVEKGASMEIRINAESAGRGTLSEEGDFVAVELKLGVLKAGTNNFEVVSAGAYVGDVKWTLDVTSEEARK